jgi:Zn-dependent peptidase ImmA (M78 family)/DNA-binding XRE family transcriptional regulator
MNNFPERLKSARAKAGYSLRELAEKMDNKVSFQALGQYEKGVYLPDSEMLALLCEALNVRPDYFIRAKTLDLTGIQFRKITKLPEKQKSRFLEEVRDNLERYIELEEIVGNYKKIKDSNLNRIEVLNEEDAEKAALELRKRWKVGLDPIAHVVDLVEDNGILVLEVSSEEMIDGMSTVVNPVAKSVIVINRYGGISVERIRFTVAHELGHLVLKFPNELNSNTVEKLCNRFAAAFLLPSESLKQEMGEKCHRILMHELKDLNIEYGISIPAILRRMLDLKMITAHYFAYWQTHLTQIKYGNESSFSKTETSRRFDQLLMRAVAEEWVSLSKAASLKNMSMSEFHETFLRN